MTARMVAPGVVVALSCFGLGAALTMLAGFELWQATRVVAPVVAKPVPVEMHGNCTRAEWRSSYNTALGAFTANPSHRGTPTSAEDRHHLALQAAAFACDEPDARTMIVED